VRGGFNIDLSKLGERLPDGVRRAAKSAAKAAEKPLTVAAVASSPVEAAQHALHDPLDRAMNPIVSRRLRGCTIPARAHVLGMADLPALENQSHAPLDVVLFRLRVERPDGDAEACVRQAMPSELRRLGPGSILRARAHEEDPRVVILDWAATAEALGEPLTWPTTLEQFAWPDPDEWPAAGAIEVRDRGRHRRRLEKRRREWRPAVARLVDAAPKGGRVDCRAKWRLDLDLDGRRVEVRERASELALARLVGYEPGRPRFGGLVTTFNRVVVAGAPIAVLVSPGGEVAVDWEATLAQPEMRAGEPPPAPG
jgi:hypothetical protein